MSTLAPLSTHAQTEDASDFVALDTDVSGSPLWNADLAPTTLAQRTWTTASIAALWISLSACIPTYMLASSLIAGGMNWRQAVSTVFLGNLIVLVPMVLNAHAGTRYGIPFPVFCRAAFGTRGAGVPAVLRALVACGWFGIQTWIGGAAIYSILGVFYPHMLTAGKSALGISGPQFLCFMAFWAVNMAVVYKGIGSIRLLLSIKAPLLLALGLALLGWAWHAAGGFGPILNQPGAFDIGQPKHGQFWGFFFPALTGIVGFWATLSLNIPDFSRYAKSQRAQVTGQALGLPLTMALYSFIGIAVTSATVVLFGTAIWDPVVLLAKFHSPAVLIVSMIAILIATLATNIAANVVSPANDFAQLAPRKVTFRIGGLITGLLGIAIMPWHLLESAGAYIFTWLVGYSALMGAIAGILICDYWVLRKTHLNLAALYETSGGYSYNGRGWNVKAMAALALAIAPVVPGFLHAASTPGGMVAHPGFLDTLYTYAWFVTFALGFGLTYLFTSRQTVAVQES